ncbi:hypothetical protein [Pasteuria penetrans]|uniref:hypothetical protein n=1 Tax=Pasteuria penetrans TaxID=86005 RepID=UPI000F9BFE89|nr:hypothetical protein [Pasteuria penetrans]
MFSVGRKGIRAKIITVGVYAILSTGLIQGVSLRALTPDEVIQYDSKYNIIAAEVERVKKSLSMIIFMNQREIGTEDTQLQHVQNKLKFLRKKSSWVDTAILKLRENGVDETDSSNPKDVLEKYENLKKLLDFMIPKIEDKIEIEQDLNKSTEKSIENKGSQYLLPNHTNNSTNTTKYLEGKGDENKVLNSDSLYYNSESHRWEPFSWGSPRNQTDMKDKHYVIERYKLSNGDLADIHLRDGKLDLMNSWYYDSKFNKWEPYHPSWYYDSKFNKWEPYHSRQHHVEGVNS